MKQQEKWEEGLHPIFIHYIVDNKERFTDVMYCDMYGNLSDDVITEQNIGCDKQ